MKRAVICFTRLPRPGQTKTRLLPVLKPEQCAGLHWAFLRDLAEVYRRADAQLFVAHVPDPEWECLKAVFPSAVYIPQEGSDLGEWMYRAIKSVLELDYEAVVLTGADLPALTAAHIDSGFAALETHDVAIGPTPDGGYYLIGMKKARREVFRVEGYGGASVFERTAAAALDAGLTVKTALECGDVDTPEDLRRLAKALRPDSHTGRYMETLWKEVHDL